jgi:3-oxoacyl-[acyl-carrier protein] reductase
VALVTGAGQGIGQAIALALAERGAQVIATDLTPPDETARKIGSSAYAIQLDGRIAAIYLFFDKLTAR